MQAPNVLFLMSDEHRADLAGWAGDEVVRTPHLDALAAHSVIFDNAYTPSPICIPGRQCLMAGQLPSSCGCHSYGQDLPPFSMTWARRLAQWGYHTVCCGKLHHMGADQMQGWTQRLAPDAEVAPRFIEGRHEPAFAAQSEDGTGKWTNQKEIERAGVGFGPPQRFDERATQGALDALERHFVDAFYDRPQNHRPLLLKLSLLQPHYPFLTDEERFAFYLNRVPVRQEEPRDHPRLGRTQYGPDVRASSREVRRATAAYYGMIESADAHFGRVLRALEAAGQDIDDWIVIYTSDHGEMLGQHGLWEKTQFYEASVRVPLFVRWPRRFAPRRVRQNVSLCDLFPTLCELCDVPLPAREETVNARGLDGRSLVPLLESDAAPWPDEAISQLGGTDLMIKRGALKYLFYARYNSELLFDLEADPGENRDFAADPTYAEAMQSFRARRDELGFHA